MTKFVLAGSQRRLSMITQIIEGQGWYFTRRIQLTLGRGKNVDDDHDTSCQKVLGKYNRISTSASKRGGGAKGKRCSRLTTTQNHEMAMIGIGIVSSQFIRCSAKA